MTIVPASPIAEGTNLFYAPLGKELDWQGEGLCRERDPEIWFPERPNKARQERKATRLCRSCPVRSDCAAWALRVHEEYGVWGGLTEDQRRKVWGLEERTETYRRRRSA